MKNNFHSSNLKESLEISQIRLGLPTGERVHQHQRQLLLPLSSTNITQIQQQFDGLLGVLIPRGQKSPQHRLHGSVTHDSPEKVQAFIARGGPRTGALLRGRVPAVIIQCSVELLEQSVQLRMPGIWTRGGHEFFFCKGQQGKNQKRKKEANSRQQKNTNQKITVPSLLSYRSFNLWPSTIKQSNRN